MTITLYGIPNCDTIKKARNWLDAHNHPYQFHDYRKQGISAELVTSFCQLFGWETVLNKRGTTYRQLSDEQKASLNQETVIELLVQYPAIIKRPILLADNSALAEIGFKAEQYQQVLI